MKFFIKLIAVNILQFIIRILSFIPVKKNRVVFVSYAGTQYSCNPRYISDYLWKRYPGKFEIIWLLKCPEQYAFLMSHGIKVVNYRPFKRFFFEVTASVSVNNFGSLYSWMPNRKKQLHINTWHGGGYYKRCGINEVKMDRFEKRLVSVSSKHTTYFVSTNQCFTDNEIRYDFDYKGTVLNIGYPRNDIFFHCNYEEIHRKICLYFGINENDKILLFAPTYRYSDDTKLEMPDFEQLKIKAESRFGGKWSVLIRMHYLTEMETGLRNTYDANYRPDAPEMQELLAAADMVISDYSSCIWDYSFTYRPCLLYTPDLDEYKVNRGFDIDIYEWGFPVCKTEQELWDAIENYDPEDFRKAMERHHDNLGSFEHGNATEIMGKLIYEFCFPEQSGEE